MSKPIDAGGQASPVEHWEVRHPGSGEMIRCSSFKEAMNEWFEGFNIPFRVVDGKREAFSAAHARVTESFPKFNPWKNQT